MTDSNGSGRLTLPRAFNFNTVVIIVAAIAGFWATYQVNGFRMDELARGQDDVKKSVDAIKDQYATLAQVNRVETDSNRSVGAVQTSLAGVTGRLDIILDRIGAVERQAVGFDANIRNVQDALVELRRQSALRSRTSIGQPFVPAIPSDGLPTFPER